MTWPDPPAAGPLGDGRFAHAEDRPSTLDDLRQAVAVRVAEGHAVYPQGGRTALDYGGTPATPGVIVDTRALDRVVDYPAADMTITVEAGITLTTLRDVLSAEKQRLLIDAPQADRATLGGIFATNTSGPRRFGAGRPRDQIIGVSFVTSDGELVKGGGRVVKNVAGYDLPKLMTGSMGSLGVICQLTLKVRPKPEASTLVWVGLPGVDAVGAALDRLSHSETRPIAVELLNGPASVTVGGPLGLSGSGWTLVVGIEDNARSVAWQVERLGVELAARSDWAVLENEATTPLWSALENFPAEGAGVLAFVANLRPSSVAAFAAGLDPAQWSVQAHAGNGIVRAHGLGERTLEELAAELDRLRASAVKDGGNLVLSRCPAEWKARLQVWGEPRPDWDVARRVKQAIDPRGVMNPGRFVGTI